MSYTATTIDDNMTTLKGVLDTLVTNGVVPAIDKVDADGLSTFIFYGNTEKTREIFRITQLVSNSNVSGKKYTYKVTALDGSTKTFENAANTTQPSVDTGQKIRRYRFNRGYSSENGVYLTVDGGDVWFGTASWWHSHSIMITRNQEGAPFFVVTHSKESIWSKDTKSAITNMNTELVVSATDVAPLDTIERTPQIGNDQLILEPFFSCCPSGTVSYASKNGQLIAGRIIEGPYGGLITSSQLYEIQLDGSTWLTDGYWAMRT